MFTRDGGDDRCGMSTTNKSTALRITGPDGLLAVVPIMLGFHPTNSLVVICLAGGGRRVGPVARVDLPRGHDRNMAAQLAGHALHHADAVVLVTYQDTRRRPPLLTDVIAGMATVGVQVLEALIVCDGMARPALGTRAERSGSGFPVPGADDPQVRTLAAAAAFAGRTTLPDRSALQRSIAPPTGHRLREAERCVTAASSGRPLLVGASAGSASRRRFGAEPLPGIELLNCEPTDLTDRALAQVSTFGEVEADVAAALAVGMIDIPFRDRIIEVAIVEIDRPWLPMLISCATWTPQALAAPLCAVLAMVAYRQGDGALAQIAVDRSLEAEPKYSLSHLMIAVMAAGLHPESLAPMFNGTAVDEWPFDQWRDDEWPFDEWRDDEWPFDNYSS